VRARASNAPGDRFESWGLGLSLASPTSKNGSFHEYRIQLIQYSFTYHIVPFQRTSDIHSILYRYEGFFIRYQSDQFFQIHITVQWYIASPVISIFNISSFITMKIINPRLSLSAFNFRLNFSVLLIGKILMNGGRYRWDEG
jgi:hypothetical protein